MSLFCAKKIFLKTATFAAIAAILLAGFSLISCEQPGGLPINARQPSITSQPAGGTWNVTTGGDTFQLTVSASNSGGGTLSYQWYSSADATNTDGTEMTEKTGNTLILDKKDYANDGSRYLYVVVTNKITDNGDGGTKTATATSNVATVTVEGNRIIILYTSTDMEKIGVDPDYPLSGMYALMDDVTLTNWTPIGNTPFTGIFDGNNKTITLESFDDQPVGSILVYSELGTTTPASPTTQNKVFLGIFGSVQGDSVSAKAEVKNVSIHSSVLATVNGDAGTAAGLVTGYAQYAVIDNITLSGTFTFNSGSGKSAYVGGVVGVIRSEGTLVKNCTSSMDMDITPGYGTPLIYGIPNPFSFVGGFVGYMEDKTGIENCHNTGDVKGISTTSGSQVMVGGILGGTYYAFSNSYHGWIADCSSKGDITVGAAGFWPMAGGIAGVICGGHGTMEGSTRIVRCFAEGTITNASTSNTNWPYIGGIVGYVYYGAWVSQSYFNGTVIGSAGYDYTGGIAGYSSYATGGSATQTCVIEDCWSDGTVTGRNNAGGIVGQNQQNTLLRRSYSRMAVHITNGAISSAAQYGTGGIVGSHSSTNPADAMLACVALNRSITAVRTTVPTGEAAVRGSEIHRIGGRMQEANGVFPKMTNVYALADLVPEIEDENGNYIADKGTSRPDGADIPDGYMSGGKPTQAFFQFIGWDFNTVWKMGSDGYPKLQWQKDQ